VIDDRLRDLPLHPDERLGMVARTTPAMVVLTDRRVIMQDDERTLLSLPIEGIRRIQLDVEHGRPATMVLVPQLPIHDPQVLSVPAEQLDVTTRLVTAVGRMLGELG